MQRSRLFTLSVIKHVPGLTIQFEPVEIQCLKETLSWLFHNLFTIYQHNCLNGASSIVGIQETLQVGSRNTKILRKAKGKIYCYVVTDKKKITQI